MIFFNDEMRSRASKELANLICYPQLPDGLSTILQAGFSKKNGGYFFGRFASRLENVETDSVEVRFGDMTGCEVSVNTIHIDDFSSELTLSIGLSFSREFSLHWSRWADVPCRLVIASKDGEFGEDTSFRFYVPRKDEAYIDYSNLNGFYEAIIAVDIPAGTDSDLLSFENIRSLING